jgi:uncharacterized protein YecT (DUF1311 family)
VAPWILAVLAGLRIGQCLAIDNPDAPDLVGQFNASCSKYESDIRAATSTNAIVSANASYMRFLDRELNAAYAALLKRVSGQAHDRLVTSERKWIQYRDAESGFIDSNWTVQNFGTSSAISRGDYQAQIAKQRVITLLQYLRNY